MLNIYYIRLTEFQITKVRISLRDFKIYIDNNGLSQLLILGIYWSFELWSVKFKFTYVNFYVYGIVASNNGDPEDFNFSK